MKYRLLDDGEIIQEGYEFFSATLSWENVKAYSQGETYYEDDDLPMRRPIEGEPVPEQKTITVRIPVDVDPETGYWCANGHGKNDEHYDTISKAGAIASFEKAGSKTLQTAWIEAVIPITDPPVIVGTVTEGE